MPASEAQIRANQANSKLSIGPNFVEGKEIIGGYLIVKANDLKEATEWAKGCPIFEHDGVVEVREIQQLEM